MTAVKWGLFVIAVAASRPVGHWLRGQPALRVLVWTLIGFLPFFRPLLMSLVYLGERPGDVAGVEVAVIDWLALTLFFAQQGPSRPLPHRWALAGYLLAATLSVAQAEWKLAAFAYVWKQCRMVLLYAVICRAEDDRRVPPALLRGMILGVLYESLWAIWQHYGLGIHQATGGFAHQNTLGVLVNLVAMVPLALILAGRTTALVTLAPLGALASILFTVSRGALLFFGAGAALLYLLSALRRFTARKAAIGLIGLVLAPAIVYVGVASLRSRSPEQQALSLQTRWQYESAASMMLREHPFGVGPNHFTIMLLGHGYGARAGVDWRSQVAIVHNIYWLTAAEMGYLGLAALVVLFLAPLLPAIRQGLRARQDRRGDVLLGLAVALTIFYAHSFFEWLWRATEVSYVYWMIVGIAATLSRELRDGARRPAAAVAGRATSGAGPRGEAWLGSATVARRDLRPGCSVAGG